MKHCDTVSLFIPAGKNGPSVVWKRYVVRGACVLARECETGKSGTAYIFYDKAKFYCAGTRVSPVKTYAGCALFHGSDGKGTEELCVTLPEGVLRITECEHFIRGNLSVHHTKLTLE